MIKINNKKIFLEVIKNDPDLFTINYDEYNPDLFTLDCITCGEAIYYRYNIIDPDERVSIGLTDDDDETGYYSYYCPKCRELFCSLQGKIILSATHGLLLPAEDQKEYFTLS